MKLLKVFSLLCLIGGVSLAAREIVLKFQSTGSEQVVAKPKIRVVVTIPRNETGRYDLEDVIMLDNGEYWAAGYDGQRTDMLFHSKDMGRTWQSVKVAETGYNTRSVMFADAENGWAVGVYGLAVRTIDGGKSWETLNISTTAELNAVNFSNSEVGYIGGYKRFRKNPDKWDDEVTGNVEIHCTEDGGATWRQCYKEDGPSEVHQIVALSETEAFVVLDGTRLIRTNDQGVTWESVPISANHVSSIAFAPNGDGWIVGKKGTFQFTSDRGRSWGKPSGMNEYLAQADWNSIAFSINGIGLAVGEGGALALSIDNGKTWEVVEINRADDFRLVRIHGTDVVVLGAKNLYLLSIN